METDDLINTLAEDATPVKTVWPAPIRALLWLGSMGAALGAGIAIMGLRDDLDQQLAQPMFLLESALITIAGLSAALATFRLGFPDERVGWLNKLLIAIPCIIWALLSFYCFYCSEGHELAHSATHIYEARCLIDLIVFGLPPGLILLAMIRRAAPVHLGWSGLAASMAVLSFAALGGRYTAAENEPAHLLIWHFAPVVILGFAGIWLGRKLFKW